MKKTILLFFATLALLGSARAQNDSTYIWRLGEYPYYYYCHDWPTVLWEDSITCYPKVRVYTDVSTSIGGTCNEYAVLFHTDDSLDVVGIATSQLYVWVNLWSDVAAFTLYDSLMSELAVIYVSKGMIYEYDLLNNDFEGAVIRQIPVVYNNDVCFIELPLKEEIDKIFGDFYIGMRIEGDEPHLITPCSLYEPNVTSLQPIPHDPPYHYEGHQYRLKVNGVWDSLRTSHYMPLLFPIYNPWCKAPDMVTASPLMDGCVDVWWNTDGIPASWEISLVGNDTTEIYTSSTTSAHICGLYPTETYTLRIRSLCEADDQGQMWSAWSIPIQINHTSVGISYMEEEPVCSIMPNPAHGSATVRCDEGIRSVELLTVKGERILYQDMSGEQACTIDLTGLAKGIYIVQITTPQGTAARKLAVE